MTELERGRILTATIFILVGILLVIYVTSNWSTEQGQSVVVLSALKQQITGNITADKISRKEIIPHKNSSKNFTSETKSDAIVHWHCPCLEELSTRPKSCPEKTVRISDPDSSLMPIWEIGHGGPSAQNLGFRHILMAAVMTKKSIILSPFVQHKSDETVELNTPIPVGLRMDLKVLCQYINIDNLSKFETDEDGETVFYRPNNFTNMFLVSNSELRY